jgi:hypothetical protein
MVRSLSPSPVEKQSSAVNVIIQLHNFFRVSESHTVCSVVNMWAATSRRKQCSSGTTVRLTQFSSSSGTYPPIAVVRAAALANVDRHPVIFVRLYAEDTHRPAVWAGGPSRRRGLPCRQSPPTPPYHRHAAFLSLCLPRKNGAICGKETPPKSKALPSV